MLQAFKALFKVYLLNIMQHATRSPELVTNELDPVSPCWEAELISPAITPYYQGVWFLGSVLVRHRDIQTYCLLEFACSALLRRTDVPSSTRAHDADWKKLRLLQVKKLKIRLGHLWRNLHPSYSNLGRDPGKRLQTWCVKISTQSEIDCKLDEGNFSGLSEQTLIVFKLIKISIHNYPFLGKSV